MIDKSLYLKNKNKFPLATLKLNQLRELAFSQFENQGYPSKKDEAWKYTSLKEVVSHTYDIPENEPVLTHDQLSNISKSLPREFSNLVFINGFLNKTLSDLDVEFEMVEADENDFFESEKLEKIADKYTDYKLMLLAQAFSSHKTRIIISNNNKLNRPLQILHLSTTNLNSNCDGFQSKIVQPSLEIHVQEGCELNLIQRFSSVSQFQSSSVSNIQLSTKNWINADTKILIGKKSNLKFSQIDDQNNDSYNTSRTSIQLGEESQVTYLDMALGSKVSRHYLNIDFQGHKAFSGVYGLSLLSNDQHCDHYTFIHHENGENVSDQHYKSILADQSESVFRGRIRINKDAQKAQSSQLNNNLLLTKKAQAFSVPQLEIYADDVKASHGSTVGQLNTDEVFYFLSRGISEDKALKLLAQGYAKDLIFKLNNHKVEKYLNLILDQKLDQVFKAIYV